MEEHVQLPTDLQRSPEPVERRSHPLVDYYQPPRLGIIHLLAWITVSAVLMSFELVLDQAATTARNIPVEHPISKSEHFVSRMKGATSSIFNEALSSGARFFGSTGFVENGADFSPGIGFWRSTASASPER